jgi:hypothetical protein
METRWPYTYYPAGAWEFANNIESFKIRRAQAMRSLCSFPLENSKSFRFRTMITKG